MFLRRLIMMMTVIVLLNDFGTVLWNLFQYFVEAGAIAVRRVRKEDLRHVAKATGATMVCLHNRVFKNTVRTCIHDVL